MVRPKHSVSDNIGRHRISYSGHIHLRLQVLNKFGVANVDLLKSSRTFKIAHHSRNGLLKIRQGSARFYATDA